MSDPALGGSAIDLDALRRSLDRAVRQALDTDEFRQAVRGAVKQFLADVPSRGRGLLVFGRQHERQVEELAAILGTPL